MGAYTPEADHSTTPESITPTQPDSNRPESLGQMQPQLPIAISPFGQTVMSEYAAPNVYYNEESCASSYASSVSSSLNIPQLAVMDDFGFYGDFSDGVTMESNPSSTSLGEHGANHLNPDDEQTPVVSDMHRSVNPQAFPAPPGVEYRQPAPRSGQPPLLSPFQPFHVATNVQAVPPGPFSAPLPYQPVFYSPPNELSQHDPSMYPTGQQSQLHHLQGFTAPQLPGHPGQPQYYAQQPFAPPATAPQTGFGERTRSRNESPTSSATSAISLARSASASSETLRPVRPKIKLSKEDKRNIVELHRSNSSLRQEDVARIYGVDRSTISKICLNPERWTGTEEVVEPAAPRQTKSVGGRFPAIEASMDIWFDEQIARGTDIRDSAARDKAKEMAQDMGYPADRFKASAKWLDKFKERRRLAGKPNSISNHPSFGFYAYGQPYSGMLGMPQAFGLARSQSAITLGSSDPTGEGMYRQTSYQPPMPHTAVPVQMPPYQADPHVAPVDEMPPSRQRSNSSPQVVGEPGQQDPSSGKATRPIRPVLMNRQSSYHGSSPSPRRPAPLIRAYTSQSGIVRRNRPTSLAASAFGITPINSDQFPSGSPLTSPASTHGDFDSRRTSEASLAPFTNSMGGMSISPTASDVADSGIIGNQPLTPITPATAGSGNILTAADYNDANSAIEFHTQLGSLHNRAPMTGHYAPVAHKYYDLQQHPHQGYDLVTITESAHRATAWQ